MTTMERDALEHARQNAQGWLGSIQEMVTRLEHCDDCQCDSNITFSACVDAMAQGMSFDDYHDSDKAREAIEESVLSVEVSGKWTPGSEPEATGYEILLTTGGPALRIIGNLGMHGEPSSAQLEMQDWGTPWTPFTYADFKAYPGGTAWNNPAADRWLENAQKFNAMLLTFASVFYFGD